MGFVHFIYFEIISLVLKWNPHTILPLLSTLLTGSPSAQADSLGPYRRTGCSFPKGPWLSSNKDHLGKFLNKWILEIVFFLRVFPVSLAGKESACNVGDPGFNSWVRKIPWRRDRLPTPVFLGFPGGSAGKESACNVGDLGLIPGLGRSPGGGHGNPLQYSCLENPHRQRSLVGFSPWGHSLWSSLYSSLK